MLLALPIVAYLSWVFDIGPDDEVRRAASGKPWLEASITAIALVGLGIGCWMVLIPSGSATPNRAVSDLNAPDTKMRSLAVLPLENLSGDSEQEFFSDGTTDMLIQELRKIRSLRIISRQSVVQYKSSSESAGSIAAALNVDGLLTGTVIQTPELVRFTLQLYDAVSDRIIWAESLDRSPTHILTLQSDIARAVTQQIGIELTGSELTALAVTREVEPESHKAYLLGRYHVSRGTFTLAKQEFERAVELDSSNADALAELARITNIFIWSGASRQELMPLLREYNRQALAIEPAHSHALATNAMLLAFEDQEYQHAIDRLAQLLAIHPNDFYVLLYYAFVLDMTHHLELASQLYSRIIELDPLNAAQTQNLGETYFQMGEYGKALAHYEQAESLGLSQPLQLATLAAAQKDKEALAFQLQRDLKDWREGTVMWRPLSQAFLAELEGDQLRAQDYLRPYDNKNDGNYWFFQSYISRALGDTKRAVQDYSRALENKEPNALMLAVGSGGEIEIYPEFYEHPDYLEMLRINGLDAASNSKLEIPPLPF